MKKIKLSAVILARNEEDNIGECTNTLSFCDEIVVIDDYSEDATSEIAKQLGAKVFRHSLESNYAKQRNYALTKARGEWVFFVDADERVGKNLATEVVQIINDPTLDYEGLIVKRHDLMWGKLVKYGEIGSVRLLRIAKRNSGTWKRRVHEVWEITGRTYLLKNPLLHNPHPSLSVFIGDVNIRSGLHAQANMNEGKKSSILKIILWPTFKFVKSYIIKMGFRDGLEGIVIALVMSFHSFLSWGKLWLLQRK